MRTALKQELDTAGLLGFRPAATYLKAGALLVLTAALLAGFFLVSSWWLKVPLFLAGVWVNVGLIMFGHESGHGTISPRAFVNDLPGYVLFPLLGGLSFNYWRHKHSLHHAYVNIEGKDPDISIYPMALSSGQRAGRFGFQWIIQRFQGFTFWVLTLFTSFAIRYDSLKFNFGSGRRAGRLTDRLLDRSCLAAHYALWLIVPVALFHQPVLPVLGFYTAWSLVSGVLLGAIFIPAHTPYSIYSSFSDHTALQVETTQNLRTNRLFSWLLIGLDHQVEHHLFPRMSHLNMRKAAPIVRAHCTRSALPYHEQGWAAALWTSTKTLQLLPNHHPLPQPAGPTKQGAPRPARPLR